jgi:hypothetical protein
VLRSPGSRDGARDLFVHQDLPDAARFGGWGTSMCAGVGIDDLSTCLDDAIADLMGR